jgi:hypothetical protein
VTGNGQKFGKLDSNIKSGMKVEDCCMQILKGMQLGWTEMMIGDF